MYRLANAILLLIAIAAPAPAREQPQAAEPATTQTGYAIVTPLTGEASELMVYRTLRLETNSERAQAETPPAQLTTSALLFVETDPGLSKDVGIAVANPNSAQARVTLTLRRDDGLLVGTYTMFVPPRWQTARFVTQLFDGQPIPSKLTGTLSVESSVPVAILSLVFQGLSFNAGGISGLSSAGDVPIFLPGVGGNGSLFLPDFVTGGGWSTRFVLINTGSSDITVRIDLFDPTGGPLSATLGGTTNTTFFGLRIRARGVLVIGTEDGN